eukprot:TRINITY_DN9472_c0_g3_i3.p3 TRINITY_DN9472_c0_g3~~TRINITY_DN9472_c0_g3_i3.p3  ORF type:complete len:193 (-),score=34.98 TRINITY_DN9472_c0_g3_i3:121-699(-)
MLQMGLQMIELKILSAYGGIEASFMSQTLQDQYACIKVISQVMAFPTALTIGAGVVDSISTSQRFSAHPLVKIFVRSSSQELIKSIGLNQQRFVGELSGGFAVFGFEPQPPPTVRGDFDLHERIFDFVGRKQLNLIQNCMKINIPQVVEQEQQQVQQVVDEGGEEQQPPPDFRVMDGMMESVLQQWQTMQVV